MPGETGDKFHAVLIQKEWSAHTSQRQGLVEPDETMMGSPIRESVARHLLADQRKAPAIKIDRLRAPAELVGRNRRRRLGDHLCGLVNEAHGIPKRNELQPLALGLCRSRLDERHPVLPIPQRPLEAGTRGSR